MPASRLLTSCRLAIPAHNYLKSIDEKVFWSYCAKSFCSSKSSHVEDHINGEKHNKSINLKKKQQATLALKKGSGTKVEYTFNMKLADAWIGANLLLHAFSNVNMKAAAAAKRCNLAALPVEQGR